MITRFQDPYDFTAQQNIVNLYAGIYDFAPVMHQILSGSGLGELYVVDGGAVAAAVLKCPEILLPIAADVAPIAWVLSDLIVTPASRRHGVATSLVLHLAEIAEQRGGRIMYLVADANNTAAIRLYERLSFTRTADQAHHAVFVKLLGA